MLNLNNFFKEKVRHEIKSLYLEMLYTLEDFRDDGRLSDHDYSRERKKILDRGNSVIRSLESQIDELEVGLKQSKAVKSISDIPNK